MRKWMMIVLMGISVSSFAVEPATVLKDLAALKEKQQVGQYYARAFMALAEHPDNAELLDATADGLMMMGALDRAEQVTRMVLELSPDHPAAAKRMKEIQEERTHILARARQLEKEIEKNPDNPLNYVSMAAIYIGLKDYQNARDWVNRADRAAPKNPLVQVMKGAFYQKLDEPTKRAISLSQEALKAYNEGRKAEAFALIENSLTLSVISPFVYLNAASLFVKDKQLGGALYAIQESQHIRKDPGQALEMGNICYLMGNYNRALQYYTEELRINPKAAEAQYNIGLCLLKLGDSEGARSAIQAACEMAPALKDKKPDALVIRGVRFPL